MFEIGDIVVYPVHGVARIVDKRFEDIGDSKQLCFILKTEIETGSRKPVIKLPVDKVESNRVRKVISEEDVAEVERIINERPMKTDGQTWNRRQREYQEKLRTGSIFSAAEVYRDLTLRKETRDLSHGERKLFDAARNLVIKELSIAKKTSEDEVERSLNKIFSKGREKKPETH